MMRRKKTVMEKLAEAENKRDKLKRLLREVAKEAYEKGAYEVRQFYSSDGIDGYIPSKQTMSEDIGAILGK